jgi:CheY-like chemotaxis protein
MSSADDAPILLAGGPGFLRALRWTLARAGLYGPVEDGDEAWLRERLDGPGAAPRAIVLDGHDPGLEHVRTLIGLRIRPALKAVPVLLATSRPAPAVVPAGVDLGPLWTLPKPVTLDALLEAADAAGLSRSAPVEAPPFEGEALLVEDDQDYLLLLKRCLAKLGIPSERARSCSNGEFAIDLLAKGDWRPSFVLLDQKMPRRTGLEVLEWIRSRPALDRLPVMLMSTGMEPALAARAASLGATACFQKPAGLQELVKLLDAILAYCAEGDPSARIPGSVKSSALWRAV